MVGPRHSTRSATGNAHRERAVNKLRGTRAVATSYDKRDYMYRGTITVAAIRIWLRDPVSDRLGDTP